VKNDTVRTRLRGIGGLIRYTESFTKEALPSFEFETHIHPSEIEVYLFSEGDLFFVFEDKRIAVEEGMVIIICNDTHHRPIIKKPCRYARTHLFLSRKAMVDCDPQNLELYKRISKKRLLAIPPQRARDMGAAEIFDEIKGYLMQNDSYGEFCATVTAISLLIRGDKLCENDEATAFCPFNDRISEIMAWIGDNLGEDINYRTVSEKFHISPKYLYKFFKKEVGITLSRYVLERRIIKAKSVLNAGGSAGEAALSAGFDDYSVFYRCFLREVGMTPTAYIKQLGG